MVAKVGVEPTRNCFHWILSPAHLPVTPLGHCHFQEHCDGAFILISWWSARNSNPALSVKSRLHLPSMFADQNY